MSGKTSFAVVRKKTPFEKHKEAEEAKRRREQEEAAAMYDDFVQSFEADDRSKPKAFVRGETVQQGEKGLLTSKDKKGTKYVPSFLPPGFNAFENAAGKPERDGGSNLSKREDSSSKDKAATQSSRKKGEQKVLALDSFMRELEEEKREREKRGSRPLRPSRPGSHFDEGPADDGRIGSGMRGGSFDDGDPNSTNLYVGNLDPTIDEQVLKKEFGKHGPLASVKIMWPRDEDQKRRGRNCGFVAFMKRRDAQAALDALQGMVLGSFDVKIGWGKGIAIPATPTYVHPSYLEKQQKPAASAEPVPMNSAMNQRSNAGQVQVDAAGGMEPRQTQAPAVLAAQKPHPQFADIQVTIPSDGHARHLIDRLATFVARDGHAFESMVMERERHNEDFAFLYDSRSAEHRYYRWRVFALANGDEMTKWNEEPFVMVLGEGRWLPPKIPKDANILFDVEERYTVAIPTEKAKNGASGPAYDDYEDELDPFMDMLRVLKLSRSSICEAMMFAIEKTEMAADVVDTLVESLTIAETPLPLKVARVYLVSDILYNSGSAQVKNATMYRTLIQAKLPEIFEALNSSLRNIEGRMTAEALKARVMNVLAAWSKWFLFSEEFIFGLEATFLRQAALDMIAAEKLAATSTRSAEDVARECKLSGLALDGGPLAQLWRLHELAAYRTQLEAEKQKEAEYMKGDGAAGGPTPEEALLQQYLEDERQAKRQKGERVPSKWEIDDEDDEDARHFTKAGKSRPSKSSATVDLFDDSPSGAAGAEVVDEAKRRKYREVEVAVMEYSESLEEQKLDKTELDAKVAAYRADLLGQLHTTQLPQSEMRRGGRGSSPLRRDENARERERDYSYREQHRDQRR